MITEAWSWMREMTTEVAGLRIHDDLA
jgi:hypothetical protein